MSCHVLSCFVSLITWFGDFSTPLSWLNYDSQKIADGQIWRLLTPIFLHFSMMGVVFAHLAFNMIGLFLFGEMIERTHSSYFLLLLVVVSGVLSNVAQAQVSDYLFGGMSGVVYALLGYLFVMNKCNRQYPAVLPNNIAYFLIAFMLIAASGILGDSIANTAHIVGFIIGVLFALAQSFLLLKKR